MNSFTKFFSVVALATIATVSNAQTPTTPPTLKWDAGEIGVIYAADQDTYFDVLKDSKGNPASAWAPVSWGQTCVISDDECGDGAAIRIDNLDFLPMQFAATLDISEYRFFHIEYWVSADMQLDMAFQNWWPGEKFVSSIYDLKAGQWNVIDIDLDQESFTWSKKKEIPQHCVNVFKLGGENVNEEEHPHAQTIWMTNIVCHNDASVAGINNIKTVRQNGRNIRYNLAGQRVGNDYKGLVLMNGKKMVMK
jgi:hypothetical protein